jgi:hypothetical protein
MICNRCGGYKQNPRPLRNWYGALTGEEQITLLAFGTYEALEKAARHYRVAYNKDNVLQETPAEGPLRPMLSVRLPDDRWLQIWQKGGLGPGEFC